MASSSDRRGTAAAHRTAGARRFFPGFRSGMRRDDQPTGISRALRAAGAGPAARDQVPRIARMDSRREPMVASTADGSYPQCAMQLAQRGSLPRPKASQSVVSISSR